MNTVVVGTEKSAFPHGAYILMGRVGPYIHRYIHTYIPMNNKFLPDEFL